MPWKRLTGPIMSARKRVGSGERREGVSNRFRYRMDDVERDSNGQIDAVSFFFIKATAAAAAVQGRSIEDSEWSVCPSVDQCSGRRRQTQRQSTKTERPWSWSDAETRKEGRHTCSSLNDCGHGHSVFALCRRVSDSVVTATIH